MTTPEQNKELVRRFYAAIERKEFDALHAMCHDEFVFYNQLDTPHPGVAGLIEAEKKNFDAFESFRFPIETLVAEGDKVAAYMLFEGRNQVGPCVGAAAKGNDCRFSLFMLLTIKDGKIVEKRAHFDTGDIYRQLTA
ncbi:MAG: ester cyclase [Gammaproteobacteria bacterium]|nr:ester cyclase [Gammaproteobacteria bacterium]MCP5201434.1 ester cyclase [Gammaproteobacteria bacterium]